MEMDLSWIKEYPEFDYQFSASSPIRGMAYFFRANGETGTIDDDLSQVSTWFRTLFEDIRYRFGKQLNKFDSTFFLKMHPYRESITAFRGKTQIFYFCQHMFLEQAEISIPLNAKHEDDVTFSFKERHPEKIIHNLNEMPEWFQRLVMETKRRVSRETRIRTIFTESR